MNTCRVRALSFSSHFSSVTASLLAALPLAAGCAVGGGRVAHDVPAEGAAVQDSTSGKSDAAPEKDADASKSGKSDSADRAEKLEKKERELACARIELDIARQSTEADEREARSSVADAEFKLQRASEDRDNYKNVEAQLVTSEAELRLEEAKERLEESRQELAELEKMYKQETFAEITKELVLVRGKVKVKMAEKGLELTQRKGVQQREFEIPKKLKELGQSLQKAQDDLDAAKRKEARVANEKKLKILKAEQSIGEIERAIAKLKSGKDDKEVKS